MPKASARWATSAPTRPSPTTPRVLPWSSTPSHFDRSHLPGHQRGVGLGDVPGLGQQERHRLLGGRQDVRLGGVDDHDAAFGGRGDVDVVEADPGPTDDDEVRPGGQHLGGDRGRRADHQRRGPRRSPRPAARGSSPSWTSTSWPAAAMRSRPGWASFSVTRTLPMVFLSVGDRRSSGDRGSCERIVACRERRGTRCAGTAGGPYSMTVRTPCGPTGWSPTLPTVGSGPGEETGPGG